VYDAIGPWYPSAIALPKDGVGDVDCGIIEASGVVWIERIHLTALIASPWDR
jgi:hypothetical protein